MLLTTEPTLPYKEERGGRKEGRGGRNDAFPHVSARPPPLSRWLADRGGVKGGGKGRGNAVFFTGIYLVAYPGVVPLILDSPTTSVLTSPPTATTREPSGRAPSTTRPRGRARRADGVGFSSFPWLGLKRAIQEESTGQQEGFRRLPLLLSHILCIFFSLASAAAAEEPLSFHLSSCTTRVCCMKPIKANYPFLSLPIMTAITVVVSWTYIPACCHSSTHRSS